ncbi:hypothetical protein EB796_019933 [Bugula neritina]|uniref:DUF5641 domain-containing protein n=1 Tax=Bugula neritina TaxID=10212 RepID=A0A7J7J868_BUGNE|nr:hypothetical protein EB796_019933 [Bugula neritina]
MELQGAVVATKLHEKLKRELDMEIDATYFWTDSTIVLGYIKNETTKFSPYVTNRVTQIRKSTEPQQWKHISGTKNPADIASRGATVHQLGTSRWFTGPEFLWKKNLRDELDRQPQSFAIPPSHQELRKTVTVNATQVNQGIKVDNFSKWHNLIRAVTQVRLISKRVKEKLKPIWQLQTLSSQDLQDTEELLIKLDQKQHFASEIDSLQNDGRMDTAALRTSMLEVSSIINSKPLTCVSLNDPTEGVITPHHLLTMRSNLTDHKSEGETTDREVYGRNMYKKTQQFAEEFWSHWKDYLAKIETRQKWVSPCANLKVGDVVAVVDETAERGQWMVGIVEGTKVGADNLVRSATVRISSPSKVTSAGRLALSASVACRQSSSHSVKLKFNPECTRGT